MRVFGFTDFDATWSRIISVEYVLCDGCGKPTGIFGINVKENNV
jgi:hypothetical protein